MGQAWKVWHRCAHVPLARTWSHGPLQGSLGNVVWLCGPGGRSILRLHPMLWPVGLRWRGGGGDRGMQRGVASAPRAHSVCRSHPSVLLPPQSGAMEGKTLQSFYSQLVLLPKVLHYAQYVLLALGCVLLLVPIVYQIRSQVGGGRSVARAERPTACLLGERGAGL